MNITQVTSIDNDDDNKQCPITVGLNLKDCFSILFFNIAEPDCDHMCRLLYQLDIRRQLWYLIDSFDRFRTQ